VEEHPDWAEWKQGLVWFDGQIAELEKGAPPSKEEPIAPKIKKKRQ
jgi:hypothetical protein